MAETVCYINIFHLTCPMSLYYLVKSRCSKFLPNNGFITIRLLRFGVNLKSSRDNFLAQRPLPDMRRLYGDDCLCFNRTAPQHISTRHRHFPGARKRDARNALSSKALITAPDRTQLNSAGLVESYRALWSQPATHLNSTGPAGTSSAILNIAVCPEWSHRPTRCDHCLKLDSTQLNCQLSWVESGLALWSGLKHLCRVRTAHFKHELWQFWADLSWQLITLLNKPYSVYCK